MSIWRMIFRSLPPSQSQLPSYIGLSLRVASGWSRCNRPSDQPPEHGTDTISTHRPLPPSRLAPPSSWSYGCLLGWTTCEHKRIRHMRNWEVGCKLTALVASPPLVLAQGVLLARSFFTLSNPQDNMKVFFFFNVSVELLGSKYIDHIWKGKENNNKGYMKF